MNEFHALRTAGQRQADKDAAYFAQQSRVRRIAGIRAMSESAKIDLLARRIALAFVERGQVSLLDLTQSGLSEAEAKRLYDRALEAARRIEPALSAQAA